MDLSFAPRQHNHLEACHTLDEVEQEVSRQLYPHKMRAQDQSFSHAELYALTLHRASLVELHYGVPTQIETQEQSAQIIVRTSLRGRLALATPGEKMLLPEGALTISSTLRKTMLATDSDYRSLLLRIDAEMLEQQLADMLQQNLTRPLSFDTHILPDATNTALWQETLRYLRTLGQHGGALLRETALTQWLARLILNIFPHNHSAAMERPQSPALPVHIRRARNYIEAHIGTSLRADILASAAGVSLRSLQNGFMQFLGMTMGDYIRMMKLEAVHRALQTPQGRNVTEILLDHGIHSPGHFSRTYRQRYGCTPSQSLRRAAEA